MKTVFDKVKEFQTIFKSNVGDKTSFPSKEERELRKNLLKEEYEEYLLAEENDDIVEVADGLGDILYIVLGTAISYGIPLEEIFNEIHASNMSKLDVDGKPIFREDGKILKGENYFRPNIPKIIENYNNEL